ncbi:MAG: SDR family NAD(P)-dependent oxidoreductase [Pyrinomonadaceae bacterium]
MSDDAKTAVIVGASSGVGRALAGALAARGWKLVLSARDRRDLDAVTADLALRWNAECYPLPVDLSNCDYAGAAFCDQCVSALGVIDALFYVAGAIDDHDDGSSDDETIRKLAAVNYVSAVKTLGAFGKLFEERGRGTLVGFSSIAAAAPRRQNVVYASAKGGLETYLRALRHRFAETPVLVQGYALGYVDTAMAYGKKLLLPAVSAEAVANEVVRNLSRDIGIKYYPGYWWLITRALRLLPWFVYKRLRF